jgi:hypothetical protein
MNDILRQIWQLPWYQVLWIAFVDDLILLVKLWPLWLIIGALGLCIVLWKELHQL